MSYPTIPRFPEKAEAVTPSDTTVFEASSIYVGGAGNVAVEPLDGGNTVTFVMLAGSVVPVRVRRVLATGTTATSLVRVY